MEEESDQNQGEEKLPTAYREGESGQNKNEEEESEQNKNEEEEGEQTKNDEEESEQNQGEEKLPTAYREGESEQNKNEEEESEQNKNDEEESEQNQGEEKLVTSYHDKLKSEYLTVKTAFFKGTSDTSVLHPRCDDTTKKAIQDMLSTKYSKIQGRNEESVCSSIDNLCKTLMLTATE